MPPCLPAARPAPPPARPQVFREVQPGLGVSRLVQRDFQAFMELAALATRFIRVKEVRKRAWGPGGPGVECWGYLGVGRRAVGPGREVWRVGQGWLHLSRAQAWLPPG